MHSNVWWRYLWWTLNSLWGWHFLWNDSRLEPLNFKSFRPLSALVRFLNGLEIQSLKCNQSKMNPYIAVYWGPSHGDKNSAVQSTRSFSCVMTCGTLAGKMKSSGVPAFPIADSTSRGARIKRGIHLHRMKMLGVERQVVGGSHSLRVERSLPASGGERRGPKEDRRMAHSREHAGRVSGRVSASWWWRALARPTRFRWRARARSFERAFGLQRLPMLVRLRVYNGERPAYVAEYALPQPEPRVELCTN